MACLIAAASQALCSRQYWFLGTAATLLAYLDGAGLSIGVLVCKLLQLDEARAQDAARSSWLPAAGGCEWSPDGSVG